MSYLLYQSLGPPYDHLVCRNCLYVDGIVGLVFPTGLLLWMENLNIGAGDAVETALKSDPTHYAGQIMLAIGLVLEYTLQVMPEDASSIHQLGKRISKLHKNEI